MVYLYLFSTVPFCGRGSVSVWRRCDTLCTSGFMDDVMFVRNSQKWATPKTYTQTDSVGGITNLIPRCIFEPATRGQHRNGGCTISTIALFIMSLLINACFAKYMCKPSFVTIKGHKSRKLCFFCIHRCWRATCMPWRSWYWQWSVRNSVVSLWSSDPCSFSCDRTQSAMGS